MKIASKSEYRYYLFAIADETAWCKANPNKGLSKEYDRGFINGLLYSQAIIRQTKKLIAATNAEKPVRRKKK